jgi:hypothetical protein
VNCLGELIARGGRLVDEFDRLSESLQAQSEVLWQSTRPSDLARFFLLNGEVDDLIHFSRARPRATIAIKSVRSESKARMVVVIPTADMGSKFALEAAELYDPLPVVLVESFGPFFNYSYSLNAGIREALSRKPDWVVISNDDVFLKDSMRTLVQQVESNSDADYLLAIPEVKDDHWIHSNLMEAVRYSTVMEAVSRIPWSLVSGTLRAEIIALMMERRYHVGLGFNLLPERIDGDGLPVLRTKGTLYSLRNNLYTKPMRMGVMLRNFSDFGVFRASILEARAFDETYINGYEDVDFTLDLMASVCKSRLVNFRIGHYRGASLSPTPTARSLRLLREVLNKTYFFHKNRMRIKSLACHAGHSNTT